MDWIILGMAGQVLATAAVVAFFHGARRWWAASLVSVMILITYVCEVPWGIGGGGPVVQILLTTACVFSIIAFTRSRQLAAATAAVVLLAGIAICFEALSLYDHGFTSHPSRYRIVNADAQHGALNAIKRALTTPALPPSVEQSTFAAGPLPAPLMAILHRRLGTAFSFVMSTRAGYPFKEWQTYLTGIYPIRHRRLVIWYPGGRVAQAIGRLTLRPAPLKKGQILVKALKMEKR